MNIETSSHTPNPQFVEALEREIRSELRLTSGETPSTFAPRMRVFRQAALLAIGLAIGVGTQIASAQVKEAHARTALESSMEVERSVAELRLQLARQEHERIRKQFEAGALARQSLLAAVAELRAAELQITRMSLDMAEIKLTSSAPRNELWAPRIGDRDFVRQRLDLDLAAAQARQSAAEAALAEAEQRWRAGAIMESALSPQREDLARATHDLRLLASRITVRDEFVKEGLTPEQVARRAQRLELAIDLQLAQQQVQLAQVREKLARDRYNAGVVTQIEYKQLELQLLELVAQVNRLQEQMKRLP